MTAPDTTEIQEAITEHWGPRCRTRDTDDFPELVALGGGRCHCCRAWEQFDALCDALDAERAENERLMYVLEGIANAIDTGRNEPLQIWRDQIRIARAALAQKGASDA